MKDIMPSTLQSYIQNFVLKNKDDVFFTLEKSQELLNNLSKKGKFPILIDERRSESEMEIDNALILPGKVAAYIEEWGKIFNSKLQKKDITSLLDGRITESFLKLHYIDDHRLDEKYPEFTLEKMLDVLVFPDFGEIIDAGESVCNTWWRFEHHFKGIFQLEDVFNNGEPAILPEWKNKIIAGNRLEISNQDQKDDLMIILNFSVSLMKIVERIRPVPGSDQMKGFWENLSSDKTMKLNPVSININHLKNVTGIKNFNLSGKKKGTSSGGSIVSIL